EGHDKTGEGKISKEESPGRGKEKFGRGDANKDGFLDKEELGRAVGQFGGRPEGPNVQEYLQRLDKNGDGKLSKEGAPDRLKENFDRLDANKDGFLDKEELGRALAQFGGRPEGRPADPRFYEEMFKRQDAN